MTDLRKAAEMALDALETKGEHHERVYAAIEALRQALDHVPDTMKMLEPDMGIDRGAWDDVPDATKWVDELRGGDETEQEPVAWMYVNEDGECEQIEYGVSTVEAPYITLLYTAPPSKPFVFLTKEDMPSGDHPMYDTKEFYAGMAWAQTKLKEKNT